MYLLYLSKFHITACAFSKSFLATKISYCMDCDVGFPTLPKYPRRVTEHAHSHKRLYVLYLYLIFSRSKISLIALNCIMSVPIHKLSEFNIVSILFSFLAISNFIKLDLPPSFAAYRSLFQPVN